MPTKRTFASICLAASSLALITAVNVTAQDRAGVVRVSSRQPASAPPVPPAMEGSATVSPRPVPDNGLPAPTTVDGSSGSAGYPGTSVAQATGAPTYAGMPMFQGGPQQQSYPAEAYGPPMYAPNDYSSYLQSSGGVTESPVLGRRPQENPLFGPMMMFETNSDDGLGYDSAYHRANVRVPYHAVPGSSVLLGDLSASVTNNGEEVYSFGGVWRNYDASRNRVFGWNAFYDMDDGRGNTSWKRIGFGFESLGKYLDFRGNGYYVTGTDSVLLNDQLIGDLTMGGNNLFRVRNQDRDNAYSGFDLETGGPLPVLGRRGINAYVGGYYLDNDMGYETVGVSGRIEALVTESATFNVNYTNDDTFGVNSWVSVSYTIPNYGENAIFQPKSVRDRLADPVQRSNRIHTHLDNINVPEAVINAKTGNPYYVNYVDPNAAAMGNGTFERPYSSMQVAADNNAASVDIIRVTPNADDSGTNLTVNGGIQLFECQALISSVVDYPLFSADGMDFNIPGVATTTNLGPLISNPGMGAAGSVIRLSNSNTVYGLRIDAGNAAGTVFGTGITNPLPITDARIVGNTFTNYETAVDLRDVSGTIVLDENTATGLAGASNSGLVLTTAAGALTNLLVRNNTVSDNSTVGISVTTGPNSTLNADNPQGFAGAGVPTVQATGIVGNTVTNGGRGIEIIARPGSTANVVAEDNTSTGNTFDGFRAQADNSTFNLASLRNNTFNGNLQNGALLHYLNGGMFRSVTEDTNGDGILDPGEDMNGNGLLDEGIVSNTMNNNSLTGLCIFGEDDSQGVFDIGGPVAALGNTFLGNTEAGVGVDLRDDATAQIDALFNTIAGGTSTPGLTFVLDFIDPGQSPVASAGLFGFDINAFDVTNFGFNPADSLLVQNAVLDTVREHFYGIPTVSGDSRSPIPDGMQLNVDFVLGDTGVAPSNGATEYYVINIGDSTPADLAAGALGGIAIGSAARDSAGIGPLAGIANGDFVSNVYANSLATLQPLNPANAFSVIPDIIPQSLSDAPDHAVHALTSGNLTFTRRAISLVTAHEIGHTLSLAHIDDDSAITLEGGLPIMGTPAAPFFVPVQQLIDPTEFALEGTHLAEGAGDTQYQQFSIAQLASAVGLRVAGGETKNGFAVSGTENARLIASTFNNNTITGASEHGINIDVKNNARVEGLTIQSNNITGGGGHGVRLSASDNAFIDADNTIGGTGTNTYRDIAFSQGNTISGNTGDGFRAVAKDGGVIHGNLLNNMITDNGGNGASLFVDGSGTLDFGTPASNRLISGNTITGNGGRGIELISTVATGETGLINAVVRNNDISNNAGGGIVSQMFGPSQTNVVNLTVGGTSAQANTIVGNGNVGVGFSVAGNAKGNLSLTNATISGTTNGPDPLTFGDGIFLSRSDSSLLLADIDAVTSINNAGNGMLITTQGNDRNDPNQPMSGTINTVDWNRSIFDNNGINGVAIRTRGDSMLLADGTGNFTRNNAVQGIDIETTQNSSFGDSTVGLPPGRRVVFDGFTSTGNGVDGLWATASDGSQLLLEVTSTRVPSASGAHAALNTNGDSNYSNNGTDGIHIDSFGNASVDVLITAETPVTPTSGRTYIQGNGTNGGGNGVFVAAAGNGTGVVKVANTIITDTIAGASEDLDGDGILTAAEDLNNNEDIDVAAGDGISYNAFNRSDLTLIVGGAGEGNIIQNNQDDGIAITAVGSGIDTSRPIVTIVDNIIGGENNGVTAGNGGDGVSLNVTGGTADAADFGFDPANIDTDIDDGDGLVPFGGFGVTQSGPIVNLTLTDNRITNNDRRGVNLLLNGAAGERNREFGNSFFDPGRIILDGNLIASNGTEGVFFRGDTDMNQSRVTYLANFPFPNPPFNPADDRPRTFANYTPTQPEFLADNAGSVAGKSAFAAEAPDGELGYLNLRTVQNTFLQIVDNTIQNNGTGTVTGEGLVLSVGTGAYLAADVRRNVFGGNLEEDVRTESFLSFGNTYDSVDDAGNLTFDAIYHDDSAQLDMRFTDNSGNQISLTSDGATYRNRDSLKEIALGFTPTNLAGVTDRDAAFFQVDDGPNLDNPNNTFINFGITQDIDAAFTAGGFNLRGAADPLFPNIEFAPFLP